MLANDRLKFRAWYHDIKKMLDWTTIQEDIEALGFRELLSEVSLMQFTGVYDSAGVPIYEGDIIVDTEDPSIGYWVVVWSPITLAFMLGSLQHDPRDDNYFKFEHSEDYLEDNISPTDIVIGNIFENEELLNVNLE